MQRYGPVVIEKASFARTKPFVNMEAQAHEFRLRTRAFELIMKLSAHDFLVVDLGQVLQNSETPVFHALGRLLVLPHVQRLFVYRALQGLREQQLLFLLTFLHSSPDTL